MRGLGQGAGDAYTALRKATMGQIHEASSPHAGIEKGAGADGAF